MAKIKHNDCAIEIRDNFPADLVEIDIVLPIGVRTDLDQWRDIGKSLERRGVKLKVTANVYIWPSSV